MINIYSESELHRTLKNAAAEEIGGKTEQKIRGAKWIFDVLDKDENAVEIQTGNLGVLFEKCDFLLKNGKNARIVRPIIAFKTVETYFDGKLISRRKSPKQETQFSIFRGIGKILPILPRIRLDLIFVSAIEIRQKTEKKVQLKNKSRRFLKDYIPVEKKLEKILSVQTFEKKSDYLKLLPIQKNSFTAKELKDAIKMWDFGTEFSINAKSKAAAAENTALFLWFLEKMDLCRKCGKKGNAFLWEICKNHSSSSKIIPYSCNFL